MPEQNTTPQPKPKGKVRRVLSWSFSPFVNVFGWLGLGNLTQNAKDIKEMGSDFFKVDHETHKEDFDHAVARLKLNEKLLQQKEQSFLRLCMIFIGLALVILLYSIYLAWMGWFFSFLIALIVSGIAFAYAFRFHFWWFQVKHHKLGCTFKEWSESEILGPKSKGEKS